MIPYTREPRRWIDTAGSRIPSFLGPEGHNLDPATVESFGKEWSKFDHFSEEDLSIAGKQYFDIVPDVALQRAATALDAGCGSGRWSKFIAAKVGFIEAVDAGSAVFAARDVLSDVANVRVTQASIDDLPFPDESFDFIFSLGVLHHLPDTAGAIRSLSSKLRKGGLMLLYLYYDFENRGLGFRTLFQVSRLLRRIVSSLPSALKHPVCDLLAVVAYLPFIVATKVLRRLFPRRPWYKAVPLSYYIDKSWRIIRNDSLDRFGTPLEKRFSQSQIKEMMLAAGLGEIVFSTQEPYWHATGRKP